MPTLPEGGGYMRNKIYITLITIIKRIRIFIRKITHRSSSSSIRSQILYIILPESDSDEIMHAFLHSSIFLQNSVIMKSQSKYYRPALYIIIFCKEGKPNYCRKLENEID